MQGSVHGTGLTVSPATSAAGTLPGERCTADARDAGGAGAGTEATAIVIDEGPAAAELAGLLAGPAAAIGRVRHVLAAHRLAGAASFSEFLSLDRLVGVDRHAYQIETVQRVLRSLRGRALLADEVGLGKTVEAIMVLVEYLVRGMARRVLVLTPPALVPQWVGELSAKAGITARSTGAGSSDMGELWRAEGVVVASLATARSQRHAAAVQGTPWDLVIVNEAHRVKNRSTLGWKLVDGLRSRFLLLLTATPIETDLDELYQLVTLLKPGQFATPAAFHRQFVDPAQPSSPKNREALRRLLGEVMVRNTRAGCGLKLPPRYVSTAVVDPEPAEAALYQAVAAGLRACAGLPRARRIMELLLLEAGSSPAAAATTLQRVRPGDGGTALRNAGVNVDALAAHAGALGESRKGRALVDLVRAAGAGAQTLVFTRFRATLDWLAALLGREGIDHVTVHGGLDGAAKQAALDAFRHGARVLLATDVGSEGHNLQHCHRLVNFDLPWNPMVIEQRVGRLHRFGQTEEVEVLNLCARGSMEERILSVLHERVRLFELVVGEMDMVLGNLADDRDLEDRVLALCAEAAGDAELDAGLEVIGDEILRARGRYEEVRRLDDALFGGDFAT